MTDTTQEYIKMCNALPEGFENDFIELLDQFTPYAIFHGSQFKGFVHEKNKVQVSEGEWISVNVLKRKDYKAWYAKPLPRLDQLFQLADGKNAFGVFTLRNFYYYVDEQSTKSHSWAIKFRTLEQMALCYVMWLKYAFVWNNDGWVKE